MQTEARPAKILRILCVRDTRSYEEGPNDTFHPIPGSGDMNQCWRCGRLHEVHATVVVEGEGEVLMGVGCARKFDAQMGSRIAKLETATARLRSLELRAARHESAVRRWDEAWTRICETPVPTISVRQVGDRLVWEAEGQPLVFGRGSLTPIDEWSRRNLEERAECAVRTWRSGLLKNYSVPEFRPIAPLNFQREIQKVQRTIAVLLTVPKDPNPTSVSIS